MKKTITPGQISRTNLELIYHYIYKNGPVSQQDIAYDLRLSRPTVTSKISDLEAMGMIRKDGRIASDLVGRKAAAYSIVPDYRVAVGVEVQAQQFKILRDEQLLGIGISVPGLVSADGSEVTYGRVLDCTGLKLGRFQKYLHFPCRFLHDASAAAGSELWASPELPDFVYLNISIHLGASMIRNREIFNGRHGYAATFEHVQLYPDGPVCYCGRKGCMEMYCSMSSLLDGEEEDRFFENLRNGDPLYQERWLRFLRNLALAVNNSHLLYDTVFVLGGYLAQHLTNSDIDIIYDEIEKLSPFPEYRDYIQISKMPVHNITIGSALPYITEFLDAPSPDT